MRPTLALTLVVAVVACEAPRDADFAPSEVAQAAPPPRLAPTAEFDAALVDAIPDAERLEADAAALAARAAALRARAATLSGPVVDPTARSRLDAAAGRR